MIQTATIFGTQGGRHRYRLPVFLLLAVTLHLGILVSMPGKQTRVTQPLGDLSLSLVSGAMESNNTSSLRDKRTTTIGLRTHSIPIVKRDESSRAGPYTDLAPANSRTSRATVRHIHHNKDEFQTVRKQLLGKIQTRLSRYLVYPPVARQRGWQGEVRLAVDISPIGVLENIQIARSSGHRLLDLSAKQALTQVRRVALASDWQGRAYTNMMIPVRYQLVTP